MIAAALLLLLQAPAAGPMTDDRDGAFDLSKYLLSRGGFLPIPIVITEPAVGYGGGLGALLFHEPPFGDPEGEQDGALQILPKSVSFAAGGGTAPGSWFAGAGHFQAWDGGDWRAGGGVGTGSFELEYYGQGSIDDLQDDPVDYTIRTRFLLAELQRRVTSSFFVGIRYLLVDAEVGLDGLPAAPGGGVPAADFGFTTAGAGLLLAWDSRDNVMTPTKGLRVELRPFLFDEALGSDLQFFRVEATAAGYLPLPPFLWSGRLKAGFSSDDTPFYQLPYVEMRGVPALRYLGTDVVSAETELEYSLTARWSVLGFVGAGRAEIDEGDLDTGSTVVAGGAGFRYLIARRFGLKAGLDVAWSNEDYGIYIQVGTAWR